MRGHDQPRRAEAALHRSRFDERLLDARRVHSLHTHHLTAVGLTAQDKACADEAAVEVDRARAALTLLARILRSVEAESLAPNVKEALAWPDVFGGVLRSVDGALDAHGCLSPSPRWGEGGTFAPGPRQAAARHHCQGVAAV